MILQNLSLKIYRQQKKRLCLKINLDTAPFLILIYILRQNNKIYVILLFCLKTHQIK